MAKPTADDLTRLKELIEQGHVQAIIDRRYPLDRIVDAHRYLDQGHQESATQS